MWCEVALHFLEKKRGKPMQYNKVFTNLNLRTLTVPASWISREVEDETWRTKALFGRYISSNKSIFLKYIVFKYLPSAPSMKRFKVETKIML